MHILKMLLLIFHGPNSLDDANKGLGRTSKAVLWGIKEVEWGGVALAGTMVRSSLNKPFPSRLQY